MQRKQFNMIARLLAQCRKWMAPSAYHAVVEHFAKELKAECPQFDVGKFLKACYTPTATTATTVAGADTTATGTDS